MYVRLPGITKSLGRGSDSMTTLIATLETRRLELGLSIAGLARQLDIPLLTLERWRAGKHGPSPLARRVIKHWLARGSGEDCRLEIPPEKGDQ